MNKTVHYFSSHGARCEADLYLPDSTSPPPVVVLAQGYAAERGFGTQGVIHALVHAGMAVFAFDYRGFGGSDNVRGQPRQLVNPWEQVEDWVAALQYVVSLQDVDRQRIGLWGSSFAGGHVLTVAADTRVRSMALRAVVAQIPHCDSRDAFRLVGPRNALAGGLHGLWGVLAAVVGRTHTVPVVGKPDGGFAVMKHPGWYEGYLRMVPADARWQNAVPAQSLFKAAGYNPIDHAGCIQAPVLMVYGLRDQGIPVANVEATAKRIAKVECYTFDGDHFDVYDGGRHQAEALVAQVAFYRRHLC